jgi:hypothetical protein
LPNQQIWREKVVGSLFIHFSFVESALPGVDNPPGREDELNTPVLGKRLGHDPWTFAA